ncbi:uncharacterized protein RCC_01001 [Ramularia collo-cygni]|uniref:Cell wall hydroxyproline-rich glycoprotein n=1 Tax=Ramularia collo-cygni TaxID=112498 RepID=A0A2D3V482_9PEZI|nr:uncharacterized protein RCC_01001 [Ramularia collo-cygni]CZT15103.1 uncharacterized protein RCC_01001 [Ramularia collo-cygni]
MSSFIRSVFLLALAGTIQAAPARRATENHLVRDLRTLTKFGQKVTLDPNGTTASWTGTDVCKFSGVYCAESPAGYEAVASIDINGAQLGQNLVLDGVLDKLTDLALFHANSNGFVGTIPDLSKLEYLYEIDLSNNQLSGTFPTTVLDRPLAFLDLRYNAFSGEVPTQVFQPSSYQGYSVEVIFLNNNKFSGALPEFGAINSTYISLANNQFTGPIPASIANVVGLKELLLLGNQLTGTVPEALCELHLDVLDVSGNNLDATLGPKCQALKAAGVLVI